VVFTTQTLNSKTPEAKQKTSERNTRWNESHSLKILLDLQCVEISSLDISLNSFFCVWQKDKVILVWNDMTVSKWWQNYRAKWTIPLNVITSLLRTLYARIKEFGSEKFPSLDRTLNHMHSKPKLEAVFIFPLLKKIKSKERNGFLWRECIRPACYMPCEHTYTALQRQSVKIFLVEICCSLPVYRLCCVVPCNSLQFTECDKNFGSHFLLI